MPHRFSAKRAQAGNALLLLGLVMAMLAATAMTQFLNSRGSATQTEMYNAKLLAQAKTALIAYAISRGDPTNKESPGQFPCPDLNGDGKAENQCGNANGSTGQNLRFGRLPWKTLGLEELKDSGGQVLWYAVSSNFKQNTPLLPLNSNTLGTILVRNPDEQVVQNPANGTGAIAIIMAAGANGPDKFVTGSITEDNGNFIDGNSSNGFTQGPIRNKKGIAVLNDQISYISYEDLMPLLEQRVAADVLQTVLAYNDKYGNTAARPAGFSDPSCLNLTTSTIPCPGKNDCTNPVFSSIPRTIKINCPSASAHSLCTKLASLDSIEIVCRSGTAQSLACDKTNCAPLTLADASSFCATPSGSFDIYPCTGKSYSAGNSPINCGRIPQAIGALSDSPSWANAGQNVADLSMGANNNWFHRNNWRELTLLAYPPGMIPNSTGCGTGNSTTLDIRTHHANEPDKINPNTALAPTTNRVSPNTPLVVIAGRPTGNQPRKNNLAFDQYFESPFITALPNPVYQQANANGPIWWTGKMLSNTFNDTVRWSAP